MGQENMKRIVIVGASSGIGREVALQFLRRGYGVGVAARRESALQELKSHAPQQVKCRQLDVTNEDAPAGLLDLVQELGGMDIFLLCAGIGKQNLSLRMDIELATAQTNVLGFIRMVGAAYGYFRGKGGEGHIAVISSIAGTKGLGVAPAYSATKRFQNIYVEALAQQVRMQQLKIRFTDIRPGFVETGLLDDGKKYPLLMHPGKVARRIVRAIERKEPVCTIDMRYRMIVFFWRMIPRCIWERLPIRN